MKNVGSLTSIQEDNAVLSNNSADFDRNHLNTQTPGMSGSNSNANLGITSGVPNLNSLGRVLVNQSGLAYGEDSQSQHQLSIYGE